MVFFSDIEFYHIMFDSFYICIVSPKKKTVAYKHGTVPYSYTLVLTCVRSHQDPKRLCGFPEAVISY